ncbi:unnamed protein product [Calypogeia fissa]
MVSTKVSLVVGVFMAAALALVVAGVGIFINRVSDPVCLPPRYADPDLAKELIRILPKDAVTCTEINVILKVILIGTHLLSFALFPFAMYTFWSRGPMLEQMGATAPFVSVVGFGFLMVSICGEIGWHVSQQWFYKEEYYVLNYVFYLCFLFGTGLWTIGVKPKPKAVPQAKTGSIPIDVLDMILLMCPILGTVVYALGAAVKNTDLCENLLPNLTWCPSLATKVPIYILMAVQIGILTMRYLKLLDNDPAVWLLPFFAVVRNLTFIFLLNAFVTHKVLNPVFHTLHDLLGTLLGVFIITALVFIKTSKDSCKDRKLK